MHIKAGCDRQAAEQPKLDRCAVEALAARRQLPVKRSALHRSTEFFASTANVTHGATLPMGIHKSTIYKPSHFQGRPMGSFLARRRTQRNGASRSSLYGQQTNLDPAPNLEARYKGRIMIAANYRKYPEAMALQFPLPFGRLLRWATTRPTTRILRTIRAARGAAFSAAGRITWPEKRSTPSWFKASQKAMRELGERVKKACKNLDFIA